MHSYLIFVICILIHFIVVYARFALCLLRITFSVYLRPFLFFSLRQAGIYCGDPQPIVAFMTPCEIMKR